MPKFLKLSLMVLAFAAVLATPPDVGAQSSGDPNVCFKTCIETYGTDKKQACALQCGLGSGNAGGGQTRDCGTVYKQCLTQCASNSSCKNQCRKQRTQCF
jgi:hypothetical protein